MTASGYLQSKQQNGDIQPVIRIEIVDALSAGDLNDLCDVTDSAIIEGGGFGWLIPPPRSVMERYWKGVLVVPERHLLIARIDGTICGATQLIEPVRCNEAQAPIATLLATFVAPFARGYGAAKRLVQTAEQLAVEMEYKILQLDVRETQQAAIKLYESMGWRRWGINPAYGVVNGEIIKGYYYSKNIAPLSVVA